MSRTLTTEKTPLYPPPLFFFKTSPDLNPKINRYQKMRKENTLFVPETFGPFC